MHDSLTSSVLNISFTLNEYTTSEADEEMVISVCKDKQINYFVTVMIELLTIDNTTDEDLSLTSISDNDPYSPNRAS